MQVHYWSEDQMNIKETAPVYVCVEILDCMLSTSQ